MHHQADPAFPPKPTTNRSRHASAFVSQLQLRSRSMETPWRARASSPGFGCRPRAHPFARGGSRTVMRRSSLAPALVDAISGARPASQPPGSRWARDKYALTRLRDSRSGSRPLAAPSTHAPHVEPTSRVRTPRARWLVTPSRWRSLDRNAPTSDVSRHRKARARRLRIDSPALRSAHLSMRGSVHPAIRIAISSPLVRKGRHARSETPSSVRHPHARDSCGTQATKSARRCFRRQRRLRTQTERQEGGHG